jgi:hypothetical protein
MATSDSDICHRWQPSPEQMSEAAGKPLILVELLNLAFEYEPCRKRGSNVKFAPQINPVFTELIHLCELARKASGRSGAVTR